MKKIANVSIAVITLFVLGIFLAIMPVKVNAGMCVGATQSFGCGDTVTESCTLDADMICAEGHGLIIGTDNITIDGNGYCLNGTAPGDCGGVPAPRTGIFNYTYDDVIIKDLEIKNFCYGIWLYGLDGDNEVYRNTIEGCHIHNNGYDSAAMLLFQGIGLNAVYDSTIKNNNIHDNTGPFGAPPGGCGIYLNGGQRNKFIENIIYNNLGSGIFIHGRPEYIEIYYNHVTGNLFGGIRLMCIATAYCTVEYNYSADNETHGITVGGPRNIIQYNTSNNNLNTTHDAPPIGEVPADGWGIVFCRSAEENEANFNTVCGNEHSDIEDSTFGQTNSGDNNACNTALNWDDEGTTDCTYTCNDKPVADFSGKPASGSVPLNVQFSDESVGMRNSWSWSFGDGGSSSDQHPTHNYENTGVYTVSLTVSGPGGSDTETKSDYIEILEAGTLNSDFSASPTSGSAPLTVNFADLSTGDINSWSWSFGDGGTSTEQNPSHIYENTGAYTVSLTVSGTGGSDTETRENYIAAGEGGPPVADFSALPATGATPLEVEFINLVTGVVTSFLWDFGDGGTSTEMTRFTHTYESAGSYTVSLTATGPGGSDTETKADYITVSEPGTPPAANFSASPRSGNTPLTVKFTDFSTGDINGWSWNFGDGGTGAEQSPTHIYENPGNYTISLNVSGPGGSDNKTKKDYITVSKGKPCPAIKALGKEAKELYVIRQFRDQALAKNPEGREYIVSYYKHAPEISSLMLKNKGLTIKTALMLKKYCSRLKALAEGKEIILQAKERQEIIDLLRKFNKKPSPGLKAAIEKTKRDISDRRVMERMGIKVE